MGHEGPDLHTTHLRTAPGLPSGAHSTQLSTSISLATVISDGYQASQNPQDPDQGTQWEQTLSITLYEASRVPEVTLSSEGD